MDAAPAAERPIGGDSGLAAPEDGAIADPPTALVQTMLAKRGLQVAFGFGSGQIPGSRRPPAAPVSPDARYIARFPRDMVTKIQGASAAREDRQVFRL